MLVFMTVFPSEDGKMNRQIALFGDDGQEIRNLAKFFKEEKGLKFEEIDRKFECGDRILMLRDLTGTYSRKIVEPLIEGYYK